MSTAYIAPVHIHASVKRRKNTWYSVKDGNWTDKNTWMSNATKRWAYPGQNIPVPVFPQVGDDVYISHAVTFNIPSAAGITVNNLFVSGSLLFDNQSTRFLNVMGDLQAIGTVNLTSTGAFTLNLYGVNNSVLNFTAGSFSTVVYARLGDQFIMDLSYRNLTTMGTGTKYFTNVVSIPGNLVIWCKTELGTYDLSVTGTTNLNSLLSKTGAGSVLFTGLLAMGSVVQQTIDFSSGNPTVECRGGINFSFNPSTAIKTGTGQWKFTGTQTINGGGSVGPLYYFIFDAPVLISGASTLTLTGFGTTANNGGIRFNNTVDGDNAGSTLLNKTWLELNSTNVPMSTLGVFDHASFANVVGYIFNGNYTLPETSYSGLYIHGTGTKTAMGDTTLTGNLFIGSNTGVSPVFELSSYNLSVAGTSQIGTATLATGTLSKMGGGSVSFTGLITIASGNVAAVDFSVGNPTVEVKGGFSINGLLSPAIKTGTGQWTFSTNNQSITSSSTSTFNFDAPVLISGAVTITLIATSTTLTTVFNGILNGNNAGSTLDNRAVVHYKNATQPMATGVLQANAAANTWFYNLNGNQDVTAGTYHTLTLSIGGAKKLLGNVVVATLYTLIGPATLDLNGYTRT